MFTSPVVIAAVSGAVVFGLLIGSFLNVVVWRLPRGQSLNHPGSRCPGCGHAIRWYDNIPVLSWLILHGKCRDCASRISVRYPAVELATALCFGTVAWWWIAKISISGMGLVSGIFALIAFLYLAAISIALALIDLGTHKLPNKIVLPAYLVGGALLAASSILQSDFAALARAGTGMAAMFLAYFLMAVAYPGGMGFGDVKLAGVLGLYLAWLGWGELIVGTFAAFVLGGIYAAVLLVLRKANRKSGIPFGPWMLAGAWVGVFLGGSIWRGYLKLVGVG
ncbi:MAG: prepilin peptidase [Homoserinimonas sp.]|nr:prepilin peptidase [Homoserinimonas sp.]